MHKASPACTGEIPEPVQVSLQGIRCVCGWCVWVCGCIKPLLPTSHLTLTFTLPYDASTKGSHGYHGYYEMCMTWENFCAILYVYQGFHISHAVKVLETTYH